MFPEYTSITVSSITPEEILLTTIDRIFSWIKDQKRGATLEKVK
jgi:hypothetical protein